MSSRDDQSSGVDDLKRIDDNVAERPVSKDERVSAKAAGQYSKSHHGQGQTMYVKVYSPFRDYYDDQAFSISAENETGPFDILPQHHNFISLLNPCDLIIRTANQNTQKISISGGIMHVKADSVTVFLDV